MREHANHISFVVIDFNSANLQGSFMMDVQLQSSVCTSTTSGVSNNSGMK